MKIETLISEATDHLDRPLAEAIGLPAASYTDGQIYSAELERIFRSEWIAVAHAEAVPQSGDYSAYDVAGEPVLLVRDNEGRVRALTNVCRHRGMTVAKGRGSCQHLVCPYHRWSYDLEGKLIAAPEMAHVLDDGYALPELSVEVWQGIVFVSFNPAPAPLAPKLAPISAVLEPWNAGSLVPLYEKRFDCGWNWKLMFENGIEGYHIIGPHRRSVQPITPAELSTYESEPGAAFATFHLPLASGTKVTSRLMDEAVPPMSGLPVWAEEKIIFWAIWPNLILNTTTQGITSYIVNPMGVDRCSFTWSTQTYPEATQSPNYEAWRQRMELAADTIQAEDEEPLAEITKNLRSRSYQPGRFCRMEEPVWRFQQWYTGMMSSVG